MGCTLLDSKRDREPKLRDADVKGKCSAPITHPEPEIGAPRGVVALRVVELSSELSAAGGECAESVGGVLPES